MKEQNGCVAVTSSAWRRTLANRLLAWFGRSARDLPWRRTSDLYAIWISEIMLQQTQVATVIPYYQRFLRRFPDVSMLATADEHEVLRLWEGLGYYRRARQLHAAAKRIVSEHEGRFPTNFEQVRSLPGIGRYTAGAVLSIGLDQRLPILEGNTVRLLSRLAAYRGDVRSTAGQRYLWFMAESILPKQSCGLFNQALMELGSEICTPRSPSCDRCPVASLCQSRRRNLVLGIPLRPKPTRYEDLTEIAVVVRQRDRVVLRHCQPGERWAGLWDFPRFVARRNDSDAIRSQIASQTHTLMGLRVIAGNHVVTLMHGVTRYRITLHCYEAELVPGTQGKVPPRHRSAARWVKIAELGDYPLSTTGRKIGRLLAEMQVTRRTTPTSAARPERNRRRSC